LVVVDNPGSMTTIEVVAAHWDIFWFLGCIPILYWVDGEYKDEWTPPVTHTLFSEYEGKSAISDSIEVTDDPIPPEEEEIIKKRSGGEINVEGITVLAFTGFDMINYIIGFILILIGAVGSVFLTRQLRRKRTQ
jgi:hypothetical protein